MKGREHSQRRDRLRLVISYRRKYLESLVRQGEEEAGKIEQEYREASAILRQGRAALDFQEEREIAQLRRLWASIELEIIRVLEASNRLKESSDYELHRLTEKEPAFFRGDGEAAHRAAGDGAGAAGKASALAKEIEELTGEAAAGTG